MCNRFTGKCGLWEWWKIMSYIWGNDVTLLYRKKGFNNEY